MKKTKLSFNKNNFKEIMLTARISIDILNKLNLFSKKQKTSRSDLIRDSIDFYIRHLSK